MNKLLYIPFFIAALFFTGCDDDFLVQKNLTDVSDETYYKTPVQIQEALIGAYACLPADEGVNNSILISNLMSDDCFGGGGTNDVGFRDIDAYQSSTENLYENLWMRNYKGIFRVNMIITRSDQSVYEDEAQKNQDIGEAYFLRAFFNLRLAQHFGSFPLKLDTDPKNLPKASADVIFGQIASDLLLAIELMKDVKITTISKDNRGHATKWAAEALLARAYLFYSGYYNKQDITLPDGSTLTKAEVIEHLDDCIENSGHELVSDFRNQWAYSYAGSEYAYAANNNLEWIGEDGDNLETIFAFQYSPYANWNLPGVMSYSNQLSLYMGLRGQTGLIPFGTGWGGGFVNPDLWNLYANDDLRRQGSIIDVRDPDEGNCSTDYAWGQWEAQHETGYYQKKYTPIQLTTDAGLKGMFYIMYGSPDDYQRWNMMDEVIIRFADVLLMAAELNEDVDPLNRVRQRAQMDPIAAYTLDALKAERRFELAFEGLRYFDVLRWHDEAVLDITTQVLTNNIETTYSVTFRPETGGFLPIPESQVRLSSGVLEQNSGW